MCLARVAGDKRRPRGDDSLELVWRSRRWAWAPRPRSPYPLKPRRFRCCRRTRPPRRLNHPVRSFFHHQHLRSACHRRHGSRRWSNAAHPFHHRLPRRQRPQASGAICRSSIELVAWFLDCLRSCRFPFAPEVVAHGQPCRLPSRGARSSIRARMRADRRVRFPRTCLASTNQGAHVGCGPRSIGGHPAPVLSGIGPSSRERQGSWKGRRTPW